MLRIALDRQFRNYKGDAYPDSKVISIYFNIAQ